MVRWLSLLRNEGVEKCNFDTDNGVFPPLSFVLCSLRGVAKLSNINRFPLEAGVLLCLIVPGSFSPPFVALRGVACGSPLGPVIATVPFNGESSS